MQIAGLVIMSLVASCHGAGYIFADGTMGPDVILHPTGYDGTAPPGGVLRVTVAARQGDFSLPALGAIARTVRTWNERQAAVGNVLNNIPDDELDFESVVLHEIGHCLGLSHNNAASESGLPLADQDYARARPGANAVLNIAPGPDGIEGTADDARADDINLNWANAQLDPYLLLPIVDTTTYDRRNTFTNIGSRQVAGSPAFTHIPDNTEAIMNQGRAFGESLRQLAADDVAGIRLGQAGLDGLADTADDYTVELVWLGAMSGNAATEIVDIWIENGPVLAGAASVLADFFTRDGRVAGTTARAEACGCGITHDVPRSARGGLLTHGVVTDADIVVSPSRPWFFGQADDCNNNGITDDLDLVPGGVEIDCNGNGIPDSCDFAAGLLEDANGNGIGDACETCLGDVTGDNDVDFFDLDRLLSRWGQTTDVGDVDFNGIVNFADLDLLLDNWGTVCR